MKKERKINTKTRTVGYVATDPGLSGTASRPIHQFDYLRLEDLKEDCQLQHEPMWAVVGRYDERNELLCLTIEVKEVFYFLYGYGILSEEDYFGLLNEDRDNFEMNWSMN